VERVLLEDFSEEIVSFVYFIGIDMFIDICDRFGGSQLYFPKKESVLRGSRNREIKRMYSKYSKSEIAKKFGITKRQVENILKN